MREMCSMSQVVRHVVMCPYEDLSNSFPLELAFGVELGLYPFFLTMSMIWKHVMNINSYFNVVVKSTYGLPP